MPAGESTQTSGLVLSGGGAFGAYEVGVIKSLCTGKSPATRNAPLDAGVFSGTSVGNFNAAVMAMNLDGPQGSARRLEKIWLEDVADKGDGHGNGVFRFRCNLFEYLNPRIPGTPFEQIRRAFGDTKFLGREAYVRLRGVFSGRLGLPGLVDISALIDTAAFRRLIQRSIRRDAILASGKVLSVTATNWAGGDAEGFDFKRMTEEETWDAICASAAIPALFPAVSTMGEVFIDGGVVMNTPIQPAVEGGATDLHVISLNPDLLELPKGHIDNTLDTFDRVYTAMLASRIAEDVESARWVNDGIEVLERVDQGEEINSFEGNRFVRVASRIYRQLKAQDKLYRKLTIHRYYPKTALGGTIGMLDFSLGAIHKMIDQGYQDACAHSCAENNCVIPAVAAEKVMTASGAVV